MTEQRLKDLLSKISTADDNASSKGDLETALGGLAREYDVEALAAISEDDYKRSEMVQKAEEEAKKAHEEADQKLSSEARASALEEELSRHPGAALLPKGQIHLRIYHPSIEGEFFLINAMGKSADTEQPELIGTALGQGRTDSVEAAETPSEDVSYGRGTLLSEAPSWALPGIHEEIESGGAELFVSREALREAGRDRREKQRTEPILESRKVPAQVRPERVGEGRDTRIVTRASAQFKEPEQKVAWAVLNEEVSGEAPIPEDRTPDPREPSAAEVDRVERRTRSALDRPERYGFSGSQFDRQTFFNQLFYLELSGFTPARQRTPDNNSVVGGFRPPVYRRLLEIAREAGFEVMGDHVRIAPQSNFGSERPAVFEGATRRTLRSSAPASEQEAFAGNLD